MPTVIVPDDLDSPNSPSELDVASMVYGKSLPRSPVHARWRAHDETVTARAQYLVRQDKRAEWQWRWWWFWRR